MKTKINGIELGYDITGQQGQPIVLIHGLGLNRTIWYEVAAKHLANHRVILPDVRGHGESEAPAGPYTMTLLAEDILRLLDFFGISKAIVCGHSLGGYIALAFADQFPDRLAGLGLIATHSRADSEEKQVNRYQTVKMIQKDGSLVLADSLAPLLSHDQDIVELSHAMIAHTPPEGLIGVLPGMAQRPDRTTMLAGISVPSLVVAGEDDQIVDLEMAAEMADRLPDSQLLTITGGGHMPMLEAPDVLGGGLLDLIHRVEKIAG